MCDQSDHIGVTLERPHDHDLLPHKLQRFLILYNHMLERILLRRVDHVPSSIDAREPALGNGLTDVHLEIADINSAALKATRLLLGDELLESPHVLYMQNPRESLPGQSDRWAWIGLLAEPLKFLRKELQPQHKKVDMRNDKRT